VSPQRPWVDIADDLRARIRRGDPAPGERLPSSGELMTRYGVARQTLQNAVDQLRAEGLITSARGRGWFVTRTGPITRLARTRLGREARRQDRGAFLGDAVQAGFVPQVSVEVRRERAPSDIAEHLGLPAKADGDGPDVVVRRRVMRADGVAVQLATSFLPLDLAEGTPIEREDSGPGGIYARLEELDHAPVHFTEIVSARAPRPQEAQALDLPYGFPVVQVVRLAHTADRVVEVNVIVMASHRFELVYEIPAG